MRQAYVSVCVVVCPKYSELYILMACNGVLTPLPTKLTSP